MSSNQHSGFERTLMVGDRVLRGDEISKYCKKYGLCEKCGKVQTHKRVGSFLSGRMEPITTTDDNGNYTVYKGHCMQPTCHASIEKVKDSLGERNVWIRPSAVGANPHSSGAQMSSIPSPGSTTSTSPRVRKLYQPASVFQPGSLLHEPSAQNQCFDQQELSLEGRESVSNLTMNESLQQLDGSDNVMNDSKFPATESHPASPVRQEYHHQLLLRPSRLRNSPTSPSFGDSSSEGIEAATSAAAACLQQAGDITFVPSFASFRTDRSSSSQESFAGVSFSQAFNGLDSSVNEALDSGRDITNSNDRISAPSNSTAPTGSLSGFGDSSSVGADVNQEVPLRGASNPGVAELEALISEGDYISFINELDRRVGGNAPAPPDRALFLEGIRLFRFYVVRDQLSRPEGVVLGSEGWVKEIITKTSTTFNGDKEVVVGCLLTFLTFSTLPGNFKKFTIKRGGVDFALRILDEFKMDENVSNLALSLILSLSLNEREGLNANYAKIATLIRRLVTVISSGDCGKDFALRALFHLSSQRRRNPDTNETLSYDVKKALSAEGNIRALFETLNEEGVREATVETTLSLLWRMSTSAATEETEDDGPFPITEDVINSLIGAIDLFDSMFIWEACCGILANLSMRNRFPSEMSQPVFLSMYQFLQDTAKLDEELATCALHAICNMLENPASRNMLVPDQRVVETVLNLFERFSSCEDLVEFGCLAIGHAARNDNFVKETIVRLGGFELVKDAFEKFVTSRDENPSLEVKDASLCAIASLSGCHSGAKSVVNSGLLEILEILLAVETDKDFRTILEVIIRNTQKGVSDGFSVGSQDMLRLQPDQFSHLLGTATSENAVVSLFRGVMGSNQSNIDNVVGRDKGYGSVLSAMARFIDSANVQENGCALLAEIYFHLSFRLAQSPNEGPWAPHNQRESLQTIHTAMKTHRGNDCIQHHCCLVMLNLFSPIAEFDSSSPQREVVGSLIERCFSDILDSLRIHESNRKAQKSGIAALGATINVSRQQDLERWIIRIVPQIFACIQRFPDDSELLPITLEVLLLLDELNQGRELIRTGSNIRLLLNLSGSEGPEVSGLSSAILASLCQTDFTSSSHILECRDAIQKLLAGMKSNQEDVQIQINIMTVLETLLNFEDDAVSAQINQSCGIFYLCNGLILHTNSSKFVLLACRVLSSVIPALEASAVELERDFLKESLTKAAVRHVEDSEVEAAIFDALGACCQQDDFFKLCLLEEIQVSAVVSAMQLNLGSAELQRSGCTLLWLLSTFGSGKEIIGGFGSIRTIVDALLAHIESTAVQKEGLTALKTLATASSNKPMIADAGAESAVIWSMFRHYHDPQVLSIGLSALNNIAVDFQTRSVALMDEQVLTIIVAAMSHFPTDEQVQKNACFYLKSCSYLPANVNIMKEKGDRLIPLLVRAADSFPQHCRDRATGVVNKLQHS